MLGLFKYDSRFDEYFRMPPEMLPPETLYRFKPDGQRMIFEGGVQYTKQEVQKLQEFFAYLRQQKLACDKRFTLPIVLKYLQGTGFKFQDTYTELTKHFKWREEELPVSLTPDLIAALSTGFLRICGRDKYYRPIIHVTPKFALGDTRLEELCGDVCKFVFEHVVHYMLIPGKVENWVVIIDMNGLSLTSLPTKVLKGMIGTLQGNYNARLAKMFLLNASFGIRCAWQVIDNFINPVTRSKIQVSSSGNPKELLDIVHPSQLFQEYGGTFEAPKEAWPPTFPPQTYRDEYETMHYTLEEFKEEVMKKPQVIPSPELAKIVKEKSKGGRIPEKTYYLKGGRIEKRGTFNEIIEEPVQASTEAKAKEKLEPKAEVKEPEEKPKNDVDDIKIEVKEAIPVNNSPAKIKEQTQEVAQPKAPERARPIMKEAMNAEPQAMNSTANSGRCEIQAHDFGRAKEQETTKYKKVQNSKACCACVIV